MLMPLNRPFECIPMHYLHLPQFHNTSDICSLDSGSFSSALLCLCSYGYRHWCHWHLALKSNYLIHLSLNFWFYHFFLSGTFTNNLKLSICKLHISLIHETFIRFVWNGSKSKYLHISVISWLVWWMMHYKDFRVAGI